MQHRAEYQITKMWRCMDHVRGIKLEGGRTTKAKHVASIREKTSHTHDLLTP